MSKKEKAQAFTEKYYAGLDNWEGLYVAEWNTHIIAHSKQKSDRYVHSKRRFIKTIAKCNDKRKWLV